VAVQVVYDRPFFEALATPHKRFEPLVPYPRYQALLGASDVALLPLRDTLFSRCKSDLKFIECAAQGVTVLASPTVYEASLVDGETGLLFRTAEELEGHLRRVIDDTALRRRLAGAAYDYVRRNRLVSQHFRKRLAWYHELLDRLPELNVQLQERVPELFPG
jgi:glycosyltransferase involved in cell wall biosynthesis